MKQASEGVLSVGWRPMAIEKETRRKEKKEKKEKKKEKKEEKKRKKKKGRRSHSGLILAQERQPE
jgi:hypothetical protein